MRRFAAVALGVALVACAALEFPPATNGTANVCSSTQACVARYGAGAVCDRGACITLTATTKPVYVVMASTTETFAAGITFAFTAKDAPVRPEGCNADKTLECDVMPQVVAAKGFVDVSPGLMKTISPPKGLLPNTVDPFFSPASLPVTLRFHPLWIDPASPDPANPRALDANSLGLPLPTRTSLFDDTLLSPPAPTNASEAGFGVGFRASVPLGDSPDGRGLYEVEVNPISPYDNYPPIVQGIRVGGGPINYHLVTLATPGSIVVNSVSLKILAAGPPPRDYRLYITRSDGVRVSSIKVLDAMPSQDVVVYTLLNDLKGTKLVLEPPDGSEGLPTQRIDDTNGALAPGIFPAMDPPVTISGRVSLQGDVGAPVDAVLIFDSDELLDKDGKSPVASYRRSVRTRLEAGRVGEYSVNLLAGRYTVYAVPTSGSLAALTVKKNFVVSAPQVGAGIALSLRWHLRGRVVLADGSPAVSTEVFASATPEAYPTQPPALPRDTRATTDDKGKFDLLVDEGTYDLTVRPGSSTRFPYVVSTGHLVTGDVDLATDLVVPVPSVRHGILLDAAGNSVVRTLIRAYAFPDKASGPNPAPSAARPARLVGEAYTDGVGRYELFLAAPPN